MKSIVFRNFIAYYLERKCSVMKMVFLSLFLLVVLLGPAHAEGKKLPTLKSLSTPT